MWIMVAAKVSPETVADQVACEELGRADMEKLPDVIVPPCALHANPAANMASTPRIDVSIADQE